MRELIGKIILDRYRVDKFLGSGGMAEVYKVWDTHRNAWLAMKVLHSDLALDHAFLRRFRREAKTLERLQHPNIVRFYGLEQHERLIFMLMDYVDGESLKPKIFDAQGPLPFDQVYSITCELAWALKYAHSEGYVHSDVKPGNIMLDEKGHVMLSDFGIARMTDTATMTMIGAGTPAYMAPEQIRGESPSIQTDIYALGIVLYEMLTGERPFNGELATISGTVGEKIRWEQMNLNVPSPTRLNKNITPELEDLLLRALAKDKQHRFQDVGEFLAEFSQIFQGKVYRQAPVSLERELKEKESRKSAEKAEQEHVAKEKQKAEEKKARVEKEAAERAKQAVLRQCQQKRNVDSDELFSKIVKRLVLISAGIALLMSFGYILSNIEFLAVPESTKNTVDFSAITGTSSWDSLPTLAYSTLAPVTITPLISSNATSVSAMITPLVQVNTTPSANNYTLIALDDISVHGSPSIKSFSPGTLWSGEEAEIIGRSDDFEWLQIRFPLKTYGQGWIQVDQDLLLDVDIHNLPVGTFFIAASPLFDPEEVTYTFSWVNYPDASYYLLTVFQVTPTYKEVFSVNTTDNEYMVEDSQLRTNESNARFSYEVKVFDKNDKLIMEAELFERAAFTVK